MFDANNGKMPTDPEEVKKIESLLKQAGMMPKRTPMPFERILNPIRFAFRSQNPGRGFNFEMPLAMFGERF